MRIERLSLQAFGPYVKRQDINLEELAKHHLFLIRGATGAGKTVILDAITYALYGKSSGGERGDLQAMRSRLASDDLPTTVELIFSIHAKRYRFYREIKIGKKRNGEPLYKMNVNGGELRNGTFYPFFENCKISALEKQAEKLIGFTHAQFIRTVMLPQGKFERLLVSNSEEKQEILKTLFESDKWNALCEVMSEQCKQKKLELDLLQQQRSDCLVQGNVSTWEEFVQRCEQLKLQEQTENKILQEEKIKWDSFRKMLEEQITLHQCAQRLQANREQLQKLSSQGEAMRQLREQVRIAQSYQQIFPYVKAWQEESIRLQEITGQKQQSFLSKLHYEERRKELQKQQPQWEVKQQRCEEAKQLQAQWEEQLEHWQQRRQWEAQEQTMKQQLAQVLHDQKTLDEQVQSIIKQEQYYRENEQRFHQKYDDYLQWVKEESLWQQRKEAQISEQQITQQLAAWNEQIHMHEVDLKQAQVAKQVAQSAHEKLYQKYLDDSAALLSSLLQEGEPCPICGSIEHPYQKKARTQLVEHHRLQDAKEQWEKCQSQTQELQTWLKQAALRKKELQVRVTQQQARRSALGTPYSHGEHEQVRKRIDEAQQAQKQLAVQKQAWDECVVQRQEQEQKIASLQKQEQEYRQQLAILHTKMQERFAQEVWVDENLLQQQIAEQKAAVQTAQEQITAWKSEWEQVQIALAQQQTSYQHYEAQWLLQQEKVQQCKIALEQQNYADLDWNASLPNANEITQMEEKLKDYDLALERIQGAIHEWEEQLQGKELLDLAQLKQQCSQSEKAYHQHYQHHLELQSQRERIVELQQQYQRVQDAYEMALLQYHKRSDFVKAMRGDTGIGIERYVLGIMLSSITQTANELLRHVHGGRYAIYRSDEATGKKRKFGLELSIYDSHSCSLRSVVSLSGGEKFLVSLALSLALSTVVQSRSGSVVMETMFIDEGFGSLDEQSIADAMQLLHHMTKGKGWIGIISHVELLKENIPYGIEVCKQKEGSSIRMLI